VASDAAIDSEGQKPAVPHRPHLHDGDPVTGQTGRLFIPVDALIGRNTTKNSVLSRAISVPAIKNYPVYDFKSEVRLNLSFRPFATSH
jgi:hypothetical protein